MKLAECKMGSRELLTQRSVNTRLCICFVLEMVIWWKLDWNQWVLAASFVAAMRGRWIYEREMVKGDK